jgi:O-antigen ligase/polysaccharide polymerase Wzy-like membrane protein/tetratricopeptide repeat protein
MTVSPTLRHESRPKEARAHLFSRATSTTSSSATAALLGFTAVVALAADHGGYWPTAWGWTALLLTWVCAIGLVLGNRHLTRVEAAMLIALAAFVVWTATSIAWSSSQGTSVLELERAIVYPLGLLAALLIVRRDSLTAFTGGLAAGVVAISTYSLATRLFPDRIGVFDPLARYRLAEPIGYWNALGIFAVMGLLLSLGFAARGATVAGRAAAGLALPVLVTTLYFTFSRGAWIALAIGLVAAVAIDPRRLRFISVAAVLSPLLFLSVWLASRSDALTHQSAPLADAARQGHRLAGWIALLAAGCAVLAAAFCLAERRVQPGRTTRRAYGALLAAAAVAACALVVANYGGPVSLAQSAYDAFRAPPAGTGTSGNLNNRLFDFSGNGRFDMWRVAVKDFRHHRLLGSGAGTYEDVWYLDRPLPGKVRDAHSLYFEVLAELGPLGLALLIVALASPLVAIGKARREPVAVAAASAYIAFLAHAGVDWDWEVTVVTLVAVLCAAALLIGARDRRGQGIAVTRARLAVPLALLLTLVALFAAVGLVGNSKLAAARTAADDGNWRSAESHARSAQRWAPWASEPWELLATAQLAGGRLGDARRSYRTATEKDPKDWTLWFELAQVSNGASRRRALAEARRLNPLSPEIAGYVAANPGTGLHP